MSELVLSIRDLAVKYGAIEALKGVDVDLHAGEVVCVLGANGAGKSTLVNSVMGLVKSREGTVTGPGGTDLRKLKPYDIARTGIAMVPEGAGSFTYLSVEENLRVGASAAKLDRGEEQRRFDSVFERFPVLRERRDQGAGTLSGGERQMLGIARALIREPRVLLLDEPSLGLAPLVADAVFEHVATLSEDGIAILLIEQNVSRALALASRGIVLERGSQRIAGTSAELLDNAEVVEAYLGVAHSEGVG